MTIINAQIVRLIVELPGIVYRYHIAYIIIALKELGSNGLSPPTAIVAR